MSEKKINIFLVISIVILILTNTVSVFAAGYLYNAYEVSYNETNNVQQGIDNLYNSVENHEDIKNRVSLLEDGYNGSVINFKPASSSVGNGGWIDFHYNGSASDYTSRIIESASGKINLIGSNGVLFNGINYSDATKGTCTVNTTNTKISSSTACDYTKIGRIVTVHLVDVCPKAAANGAAVIAVTGIPAANNWSTGSISCAISTTSSPSYRVSISGDKMYWNYTGGNDNCYLGSGELVYISAS